MINENGVVVEYQY